MTTRHIFTERHGVDREPRFVQMGTGHHEELTEGIDEAGIRKADCYCEQEKIDGVHSEGVYEIVPNARYRRNARLFCRKPVCRLNKQGVWLNLDVGEFVEQRKVCHLK